MSVAGAVYKRSPLIVHRLLMTSSLACSYETEQLDTQWAAL